MALLTLEGTYEDGKIALAELPEGLERARVVVTFLPDGTEPAAQNNPQGADDEARQRRREAGRKLVALFEKGSHLGGPPYPTRDDLYNRGRRDGE